MARCRRALFARVTQNVRCLSHNTKNPQISLLGPPEILNREPSTTTAAEAAFMEQMVAKVSTTNPPMGLTEKKSPTFRSTGNPCLDFFFHVVPDTPPETLTHRLGLAWAHNPITALKLVCNLRGVGGTGKSDREGFYIAALWLHAHHPKTLAFNVPSLSDFGYFKDLPEILYRILEGYDVRKNHLMSSDRGKKHPKDVRQRMRVDAAEKLINCYQGDPDFRLLYDSVSNYFAECLKKDLENLKSGSRKLSLAAKWCPSLYSTYDRSTLLCESIARKLFPREEYEGVEEAHYAYKIRIRLQKEVLAPLRRALESPEVYVGTDRWDLAPYDNAVSEFMEIFKGLPVDGYEDYLKNMFLKHDEERYKGYMKDGAFLPHQIIAKSGGVYSGWEVTELQWKRMVDDLLKKGKLKNCLAICDVSRSMEWRPLEVSVALGLLASELSEEPWKGNIVTISDYPHFHLIKGNYLKSKLDFVKKIARGKNSDFQQSFDYILEVIVNWSLKEDQMIKRVFVFSDMEFDQASANSLETDYQAITRKFEEKGCGSAVPQIIFWKLRDSMATPVPATQTGVALVSGFSQNLLKLFMDDDVLNPEEAMKSAISGPEYQKLVVLD